MDTFLIDRYAAYLAAGGRQSSTIKLRRSHLIAATRSIGSLETASSAQLEDYLANPGWKPTTRRSHRASIVQFYRWLLRSEHITINPAAIQAAPPRVQLMLELMAYAGLRRMEVARVHTKDVIITDHASALRVTGKGGHTRIVPIPGHLAEAIRRGRGWLFPGDDSGHLSAAYVGRLVSRSLPPGVTGHMLRHRYATEGYRRGRDIRAVQELLGHAKLDTTMAYTRVASDQTSAVAALTWTLTA